MPGVGSRCLALIAVLAAIARPLPAQEKSLPQRIADVIVQLNGGIHTGFRFMHAKGLVVTGTFTPARGARSISTAAHLNGAPVPVTVRFSDGTGVPTIPDTDTRGSPRGMAIRFNLPGGAFTDIVAISHNGFVVGTGEEFLAFLTAVARRRPRASTPTRSSSFSARTRGPSSSFRTRSRCRPASRTWRTSATTPSCSWTAPGRRGPAGTRSFPPRGS